MATFKKSNNLQQLEEQIEQKNKSIHVLNKNDIPVENDKSIIMENTDLISELSLLKVLSEKKALSRDLSKKRVETISLRISLDTQKKLKILTKSGLASQSDVVTMLVEKLYEEATNGEPNNI